MRRRTTRCVKDKDVGLVISTDGRLVLDMVGPPTDCTVTIADSMSPGCDVGHVVLGAYRIECDKPIKANVRILPIKLSEYHGRVAPRVFAQAVPGGAATGDNDRTARGEVPANGWRAANNAENIGPGALEVCLVVAPA